MIVEVGPVAHGGHCVAREDGRVIFVRHALPGERVRVEVTERKKSFWKADAVEILTPSPDRVVAPCRFAGLCGGCDFQHVSQAGQLALKSIVLREQLVRMGGFEPHDVNDYRVESLPDGLTGWRTRMQYAVSRQGRPGLRMYRSHDIVHIDECVIADKSVAEADVLERSWRDTKTVGVVASGNNEVSVYLERPRAKRATVVSGPKLLTHQLGKHRFSTEADAFWQVHPHAASTLVDTVQDFLCLRPADTVWDLYAGAGLFAAHLAGDLTEGKVIAVESDNRCRLRANMRNYKNIDVVEATVENALATLPAPDVVVLDPPRNGAGKHVINALTTVLPREIVYVACDPAALARDLRVLTDAGYTLSDLKAFDAFPMTHHFETVVHLVR